MKVSRRDLLLGTAGATAGLFLTPVPWKLLDDVSIWTQNWPWIPQPAHGPVDTKLSACTLCPAGCGIRVRMAAGFPVGIAGVRSNPVTKGALCPLGFAAHQLNWHPSRLREVRCGSRKASWTEAQAAFQKACSEGPIAIVDGRPGRAASSVFESFTQKQKGSYQAALSTESQALTPYANWTGLAVSALGYDLENARTIVSFGAPLLDGWGTPGRFTHLWSERGAGAADPELRLIQIESYLSHTASRAWRWLAIREGTSAVLAAGVACVLLEEHLVKSKGPTPQISLADAAAQTGLSVDAIRALARTLVERQPALVISADANPAIAALNVLLGAMGTLGGVVRKKDCTPSRVAAGTTINAPRAVLLDSTVPWEFVPPTGADVFRFAAWDGGGNKSDWLLPAPGFLEDLTDIPTAPASAVDTYAIGANLLTPAPEIKSAAQFLLQVDPTLPAVEKVIQARCEELFHAGLGTVHGEQLTAVAKLESAKNLEEQLRKGAVWMDEPARPVALRCELKEWPQESHVSRAFSWDTAWALPVFPPLAAKLYQESNLRETPVRRAS